MNQLKSYKRPRHCSMICCAASISTALAHPFNQRSMSTGWPNKLVQRSMTSLSLHP